MEGMVAVSDSEELLAKSCFQSGEIRVVVDYGIGAHLLFETELEIKRRMMFGVYDEIWLLLQIDKRRR
jgi:hypothetical protein